MTISPPATAMLVLSVIFLNFGCINILVAVMVEHIMIIAKDTRENFSKALATSREASRLKSLLERS